MFDPEFYPTPEHVIHSMLSNCTFQGKRILEPSAGKGNIVDYLNNHKCTVYTCERNIDLANIVSQKSHFLTHDFFELTDEKVSHIELIVMNPPFSNADKHMIHAWNIAPEGCEIIALCNSTTIRNNFSSIRRELQSIIENYGYTELLGNVFHDAERTTDVCVSVVRLKKPSSASDEFDGYFDQQEEVEFQQDGIMPYNEIREIVNRYVTAVRMFDQVKELNEKINDMASLFSKSISFGAFQRNGSSLTSIDRDTYKKELQKEAWKHVFHRMNMDKYMTKKMKADVNKFVEIQTQVPFTMGNVYKMIEVITGTHHSRMDQAIVDVFDLITRHYHENKYNVEGWKTNDSYIVNKKIILPYMVSEGWDKELSITRNGNSDQIEDMTRALCYLTGTNFDSIESLETWSRGTPEPLEFYQKKEFTFGSYSKQFDNWFPQERGGNENPHRKENWIEKQIKKDFESGKYRKKPEFGVWYDWGFFRIKAFKKGTMHFEFKDLKVWELFNRKVAQIKGNVLPEKF